MQGKQYGEFMKDAGAAYNGAMGQLHMKWGGRLDKEELRLEFHRFVTNHAVRKAIEANRRRVNPVRRLDRVIGLLERNQGGTKGN